MLPEGSKRSPWWAKPDDLVFRAAEVPGEPVFFVEYLSRPSTDQRQRWLATLLENGKLSLAQALVLKDDWHRTADEARILALMEATRVGTSVPRPWAPLYLRMALRGKSGPGMVPILRRSFWRNLLETDNVPTDELLAPYRERLTEADWSRIDRWDAETMRDLGFVDLSVAPEEFRPYRTGDALYFFDPSSRGFLAWVRYQGRSPHPPDQVETGRMTLDEALDSRRASGTMSRGVVWKGGPDEATLDLPRRTVRTTLRQAADGSWSLGWGVAP